MGPSRAQTASRPALSKRGRSSFLTDTHFAVHSWAWQFQRRDQRNPRRQRSHPAATSGWRVRRTSPPFTSSLQLMKHTVAKRDKYHVRAPLFLARQFGGFLFASVPESGKLAFPFHTAAPKVSFWFPSPGSRFPSPTLQPSVGCHLPRPHTAGFLLSADHGNLPIERTPDCSDTHGDVREVLATWPDGLSMQMTALRKAVTR
ncbi:hypothetical protein QO002_005694 [Pararhizobium capsulatum DSM 1112]|uniref:Uncharacterized protein n=1 Tax=Pararhizobium capsulatum DSM 1112 TaxID=1121113 RepID=A0ABU0BYZ1_9HYPH|nr:hypothetical protein [Pararhizobium capsulatum DSM 1112]